MLNRLIINYAVYTYMVIFLIAIFIIDFILGIIVNKRPRQLQLPLHYKTNKTRLEYDIEIIMNTLSIATLNGIFMSKSFIKLDNIQMWVILFISMGTLLIKGLDEFVRVGISFVALSLFLYELIKVYPLLVSQILTLMIIYIGFYLIVRREFNLELIANSLAIGTVIKLLYLKWSWITATVIKLLYLNWSWITAKININSNPYESIFIILFLFLLLSMSAPVIEDIGRLLIAIFATIGLMVFLFNEIPLVNFLILLISLLIYLSFSFKLRGGT